MTTHNGVAFKVFVSTGGEKAEVRRFAIDREVVTSFEYLKAKLHSVFPSIKDKTYTISWKGKLNSHSFFKIPPFISVSCFFSNFYEFIRLENSVFFYQTIGI